MLLKSLILFALVLSLEAASITKEIPVNVVYVEAVDIQENPREKSHVRYLQNRNLDEKVQLSGRELKEASQHIPIPENDGKLFTKTKAVFLEKLSHFKDQVDGFSVKTSLNKPTSEDWAVLNEKLQVVFKKYEMNSVRQNQGGFFSELQQVTSEWFQSFGGNNNNKPGGEEDEQPQNQGGLGQVWTNFQNSVSQAFSNLSNNNNQEAATTSNTVLGDTGVTSTTNAPGFFQNIVSNIFNNNNNQANKPGQEDTGVTSQPNVIQGAISNIINTFSPSSEKPSNSQGDTGEASTAAPGNQFFQNLNQAFGQVFGQNTKPPGASGDNAATNKPNFFENVFQNVFNQNQASTTVNSQGDGSTPATNLVNQGLQQIQIPGQNFAQNFGQQINGGSQNNQIQQISEGFQNPQNFINQAQNIGQQFGGNSSEGSSGSGIGQQFTQVIQNPQNFVNQAQNIGQQFNGNSSEGSSGQGIGQQISQAFQNPQNFASQAQNIGQQFSGNSSEGSSGQGIGQQISQAFQNPQNFASQAQNIGQQFSGNSSEGSSGQGIGQQISQAFQNPQNFASQAQNIGQQFSGNSSQGSNGQAIGQQISQAFQNPQNFATQAQNIGQQFGENIPSVPQNNADGSSSQGSITNLNINQIPVIGQQINQNSNPIQNFQTNPSNIVNQIQSSTNQFQNPGASGNSQNQQVNVNQLNQIIPQPQNSNGIQAIANQFNNGLTQLGGQNGSNNVAAETNQQNVVKPVNEKVERKTGVVEKEKADGEGEIMMAFER